MCVCVCALYSPSNVWVGFCNSAVFSSLQFKFTFISIAARERSRAYSAIGLGGVAERNGSDVLLELEIVVTVGVLAVLVVEVVVLL